MGWEAGSAYRSKVRVNVKVLDFVKRGWAWMDSNQRHWSYQDPSRQYPVPSLTRSSSLTNLDSPTNFVASAAPNTGGSLSLYDYAAKGYGNRRSSMIIVFLRCPPL